MTWKCPKCSHKSQSYVAMQRHYFRKHHKPKPGSGSVSKGKDKKVYTFRPTVLKKR